jgi:2-dehydro-3-deoxyphosphogluconate aldolase / (4S)-4-hydroxy-2-oxoglutarate aldolase
MSFKQQTLDWIQKTRLMAALRGGFSPKQAIAVCEVLLANGMDIFEFTMNSKDPVATLEAVKRHFGNRALVCMGTVLSPAIADEVLDAGADFILSPGTKLDVVRAVHKRDRLICAGVFTATECISAWENEVRLLKLFPVGPVGVNYFRAIRGPLNNMNFLCDGGMHLENVGEFLAAGAFACGLVEALTGTGTEPLEEIDCRAKALKANIAKAQQ